MIAHTIVEVTQQFLDQGTTPYEINNGYCYEWAEGILERLRATEHQVELWEVLFGFGDTTHAFLRINGKFYDAECHEGVEDHMDLPIFKKLAANGGGRQPVWCIDCNHDITGESRRDVPFEMLVEYDEQNGTNNSGKFPQQD